MDMVDYALTVMSQVNYFLWYYVLARGHADYALVQQ